MTSPRVFTMFENNPEIMTDLGHRLGPSKGLQFYDIYSLDDPDLRSLIPSYGGPHRFE
ncbi:hypothetical protein ASPSYDRAFT_90605 [Aspergillus sydowii CBS 593.65]|uniref:ubiquitinyl hydrolase 1 n=1 Tax=Aspergillus sydowii CBS 593.65 TaxID=1036612 RepID=A0A1L9TCZ3_9EURO|nr:uncharacterized protein ASPSYDRAFT_90605 [Aspergillus sydowii CBS 593.65]OJJ57309.1 hypothetical protein ASPSYDRAFT_90605 [Aspergillus sydowii CBS 593.65]